MFFPQACLVGYQNSGCEHKGDHSKEILDPPGHLLIRARSSGCEWANGLLHGSAKSREPKLAVPYKGNRETFVGLLIINWLLIGILLGFLMRIINRNS